MTFPVQTFRARCFKARRDTAAQSEGITGITGHFEPPRHQCRCSIRLPDLNISELGPSECRDLLLRLIRMGKCAFKVDDDDVTELAAALPRLETLSLGRLCFETHVPQPLHASFRSLFIAPS